MVCSRREEWKSPDYDWFNIVTSEGKLHCWSPNEPVTVIRRLERQHGQPQESSFWYWLSSEPRRLQGLAYTLQVVRYLQVRPAPSEHQKILRAVPVVQDSSPRTVLAQTTAPTELPTRLPVTTISVLTMRIGVPTSLKILRRFVEPTEL